MQNEPWRCTRPATSYVVLGPILTELMHNAERYDQDDPMDDYVGFDTSGYRADRRDEEARAIVRRHGIEPALFNEIVESRVSPRWIYLHPFARVEPDASDRWLRVTGRSA